MLSLSSALRIFLAVEPADMRKGFDGLSQLVRERIAQDPLSGHLFVFRNRRSCLRITERWEKSPIP